MGYDSSFKSYSVIGEWDPVVDHFGVLNTETPKGLSPYRLQINSCLWFNLFTSWMLLEADKYSSTPRSVYVI